METVFEVSTAYDAKMLHAMARALRKTVRRRKSVRTHIFGWIVVILGMALSVFPCLIGNKSFFGANNLITFFASVVVLFTLLFEDRLNAYVSRKRMLPGSEQACMTFDEEGYTGQSIVAQTRWQYEMIEQVCEDEDYFFFFLSKLHGQGVAKSGFTKGNADDFRVFITQKTGKPVKLVK